jgi:hypothetical protein
MTFVGPPGQGPGSNQTPTELALRAAMARSVARVPDAPDLMGKALVRAARLERRRRALAVSAAGTLALVVVAGGTTMFTLGTAGPRVVTVDDPASRPSGPTEHGPTSGTKGEDLGATSPSTTGPTAGASTRSTTRATTRATTRPTTHAPTRSTGGATTRTTTAPNQSATPAGPWTAVRTDEGFAGSSLDTNRWLPYTGAANGSPTTFSPQALTVQGGTLRITVDRTAGANPPIRGGGVKAAQSQQYGRWEVRWRMSATPGATAEFVLLGDGPGGIGQIATLSPADRRLTIDDRARGTSRSVSLDATQYHLVTLESTPQQVRWLVDGRVAVTEPGGAPSVPVNAAVQALVSNADCGATPLPSACTGPAVYPQHLDVDYFRYWAYQP